MALLTACTAANRVIETELVTTFSRDTVYIGETKNAAYGFATNFTYFLYTRNREMQYSYVGLTQAAAKSEALRIWLAYRRKCWQWNYDSSGRKWTRPTANSSRPDGATTPSFIVEAASVSASLSSGAAWKVEVNVKESISIPYKPISTGIGTSTDGPGSGWTDNNYNPGTPWTAFETNPDIATSYFRGLAQYSGGAEKDFDYYI